MQTQLRRAATIVAIVALTAPAAASAQPAGWRTTHAGPAIQCHRPTLKHRHDQSPALHAYIARHARTI